MYIAFKWLTGLTLVMWTAMCLLDIYLKNNKKTLTNTLNAFEWTQRNSSEKPIRSQSDIYLESHLISYRQHFVAIYHYIMFFAGAFAVCVFNKKQEIFYFTKSTILKINMRLIVASALRKFVKTILQLSNVCKGLALLLWISIPKVVLKMKKFQFGLGEDVIKKEKLNVLLLRKLKEFVADKKKLGQLLMTAVQENKNIRMQYQLESMARSRLLKHIEDTQEKIKENRSRYVSFQQLYMITHQENMFLKARIKKLTNEKDKAQKDLLSLINKVFHSANNELKLYSTQFIVKPKNNLLHTDAKLEVQKFLKNTSETTEILTYFDGDSNKSSSRYLDLQVTEIMKKDSTFLPLVLDAPRFKGLPGECIWTVKDKDGMIEKLYEYDFESDLDKGDTIRRIREYSVYYDKDCLLDCTSSRTIVCDADSVSDRRTHQTNQRFLTGSEAFQNFMQNNKKLTSAAPTPSLLCV